MTKTINDYFNLSDIINNDEKKLSALINLFSNDAIMIPNDEIEITGKTAIKKFFTSFFQNNQSLKHLWKINEMEINNFEVYWGVVGIRKSGQLFTLKGVDYIRLDNDNKISYLKVKGH